MAQDTDIRREQRRKRRRRQRLLCRAMFAAAGGLVAAAVLLVVWNALPAGADARSARGLPVRTGASVSYTHLTLPTKVKV